MNQRKKQIERYHLERFISNESLKLVVFAITEDERPDFSLKLKDRQISIEHTRLLNPDLQEKEQYKDKIIKSAQKLFENKYREKLYTLITFHDDVIQSGKKNQESYVNHVFSTIEEIYLNNKNFEFHLSSKRMDNISDLIENIDINNKLNFSHWQHFGAYSVEMIDKEWFIDVIKRKEQNISKYVNKFDENWLLLVSDFGTEASTKSFAGFDFSEITTQFDKVYLYSFMPNSITIVK